MMTIRVLIALAVMLPCAPASAQTEAVILPQSALAAQGEWEGLPYSYNAEKEFYLLSGGQWRQARKLSGGWHVAQSEPRPGEVLWQTLEEAKQPNTESADAIPTVSAEAFHEEVLKSDIPVVVDVGAEWCPACHALKSTIKRLAERYKGRVRVVQMDVDESQSVLEPLGIQNLPTVLVFHRGEEHRRDVGVQPLEQYQAALDDLLHKKPATDAE